MTTISAPPLLSLQGLRKTYAGKASPALAGATLHVERGQFFGLLGPNGAGKTTLISLVCGLLKPDSGTILYKGQATADHPETLRRALGLVPQDIALYPSLTARENLRFFGGLFGLHGRKLEQAIDTHLAQLGLSEAADQRTANFSGGMKRRCNLIAALLHAPELLILDEPTAGVDPQSRLLLYQCLKALNKQGTTILCTTHLLPEAEELCSHIAILDAGRTITEGPTRSLIETTPGARCLDDVFFHHTGHALRD